jgi:hypothetical protein
MDNVAELLAKMRGNEALYCGRQMLSRMAFFIRGYDYALIRANPSVRDATMELFQIWLEHKFNVRHSKAWEEIILFHSSNDSEAVQFFWELFDEFNAERSSSSAVR